MYYYYVTFMYMYIYGHLSKGVVGKSNVNDVDCELSGFLRWEIIELTNGFQAASRLFDVRSNSILAQQNRPCLSSRFFQDF